MENQWPNGDTGYSSTLSRLDLPALKGHRYDSLAIQKGSTAIRAAAPYKTGYP